MVFTYFFNFQSKLFATQAESQTQKKKHNLLIYFLTFELFGTEHFHEAKPKI